jgi:hypothetical protein
MRKSQAEPTTAENLERKFDQGENVLDYFNVRTARVVRPPNASASSGNQKTGGSYAPKSSPRQKAAVRDRVGHYRSRKKK